MQNLAQMLEGIKKLVLLLPENESEEHGKPKQNALSKIEETKRIIETKRITCLKIVVLV